MLFCVSLAFGQTEAEMQTQADKLFNNEQYLEATSLYLRLLSLQPKSTNYNYKYGACLLHNSHKKSDAIKYLRYAASDPAIPSDVYYFLGKAFHLNYQFGEAIKNYTTYNQNKATASKKFDADREIQMCNNGKNLMSTLSDLIVQDKKEIQTDKFFRLYDLKDIGGSMLVTAEFQSKLDKKYNHIPVIHFPQNPSVIYYSSYGETEGTGKDIYVRRRLPNGTWGEPQKLQGAVNTKYDEDFPYMHPDGKWLYFSSKGHNSMGGYDVFRSMYIPDENTFATPENMDFAISSPDDDLFYVVDSLNKNAYFASARQSQEGKFFVYKVIVERVPIQLAVVKGKFISEINPDNKRVDIEIRDLASGNSVGKFNSNEKATYLLTFPKGGKYEYIIRIDGDDKEYRAAVNIPFLKEFKPLKQKIIHINQDGQVVVKVVDLFNEEVDDPQAVLAEVIQMRSELNVNVQEFNMDEMERMRQNMIVLQELGYGNISLVEVKDKLQEDIKGQQDALTEASQMMNNINSIVVENSAQILQLDEAIKKKVADANIAETEDEKYKLLREAAFLKEKQNEMKGLNTKLLASSDSIKTVIDRTNTSSQIKQLNIIADQYNKLLDGNNKEEAVKLLVDNKDVLTTLKNDKSIHLKENLVAKIVQLDQDQAKINEKINQYDKEIRELEAQIQNLQNDRLNAKKKDLPAIDSQISSKTEEIAMIRSERAKLAAREEKIVAEKAHIAQQVDLIDIARNNKAGVDMTRDEANLAIQKTNSTNSKTLGNFVDQQIAEMEKKDPGLRARFILDEKQPALANMKRFEPEGNGNSVAANNNSNGNNGGTNANNNGGNNANIVTASDEKKRINAIKMTFEEEKKKILQRNTLTEEEKLNEQKLLIDRTLAAIEKEGASAKFPESVNELKTLKQSVQRESTSVENAIAVAQNSNQSNSSQEAKTVAALRSNYEEQKGAIRSNNSLSKEEMNSRQKELNNKFLTQIDEMIAKGGDQKVMSDLSSLRTSIENENATLLASNETNGGNNSNQSNTSQETPAVRDLRNKYEAEKNQIRTNNTLSKEEIATRQKELNNKYLNLVEDMISKGGDQKSISELSGFKSAIEIENSNIAASNETNGSNSNQNNSSQDTQAVNDLKNSYEKEKGQLRSNPSLTKEDIAQREKQINDNYLAKIEVLVQKGTNEKALDELNQLKTSIEADNSRLLANTNVNQNQSNPANELAEVQELRTNYLKEKQALENNKTLDRLEQIKQQKALNNKVLTSIEKQLKTTKDADLIAELNDWKSNLGEENKQLDFAVEFDENLSDNSKSLIESLDKNYNKKSEDIQNNTALSKIEKNQRMQQIDKELLTSIESRIKEIETKLKVNPSDEKLLAEKSRLENLASIVESKIEEREQMSSSEALASLSEQEIENRKLAVINNLDQNYLPTKETLSQQKNFNQLLSHDKAMKEKVRLELQKIEKQLKNSPANNDLLMQKAILERINSDIDVSMTKTLDAIAASGPIEITSLDKEQMLKQLDAPVNSLPINQSELVNYSDEKLETLKDQITDLQAAIIARSETAQDELKSDPENREAKKDLAVLEVLKNDVDQQQKAIDQELNKRSVAAENQTFSVKEVNDKIAQIAPTHQEKMDQIEQQNEISEKDRLTAKDELIHQTLNQVLDEQLKVGEKLENNPTDKKLQQESKLLEAASKKLEEDLAANEAKLAAQNNTALNDSVPSTKPLTLENVKDQLVPGFEDNVKAIKDDASLPEETKRELLTQLNEALIQKADERLEELSRQLAFEPRKQSLVEEKALVEQIKNNAAADIQKNSSNPVLAQAKEKLIQQLLPNYQDDKNLIVAKKESFETVDQMINLESSLLTKLNAEQKRIEKALAKSPTNEDLKKQLELVNELIAQQNDSIEGLTAKKELLTNSGLATNNEVAEKEFIQNLRADLLGNDQTILTSLASKLEDLKVQEEKLKQYDADLTKEIEAKELELKSDPKNAKTGEELAWLKEEQSNVKKQLRSASIEIGELTQVATNQAPTNTTNPELNALNKEKNDLQAQLSASELSPAERKKIEKELSVVNDKVATIEEKQLVSTTSEKQEGLVAVQKELSKDTSNPEVKIGSQKLAAENAAAEQLIKEATTTKDKEEKVALLKEAESHQAKAQQVAEATQFEKELSNLASEFGTNGLQSKEDLERKKRQYTIEIGELTEYMRELDSEIQTANKKEVPALEAKKTYAAEQKKLLEARVAQIDEQLAKQELTAETIAPEAKDVAITYNEERELASTEAYNTYVGKANEALLLEKKIADLEVKSEQLRSEVKDLLGQQVSAKGNEDNSAQINAKMKALKETEDELNNAKTELKQKQEEANQTLPTNTEEAMKMMNLMKRGVAPINKMVIAAALVPMPASGLEIKAEGINMYSDANRIPVNVNNPKGLVYRVQIGAFAKAIDQNQFKEFNPVSGETLTNGITRYMAGYFNSNANVMDALAKVKGLGYADAFPVAYCDGVRINLAEARRLEASGECVPKGSNEMMIEVAASTAITMGLEDTTKLKKVPEYTYNQAPGAAKAEAIELKKGLFFTVQIGVYNKPVSSATLFNLNPYMSLRLPNGQIRYSTGIYHSIDEARPRKAEAITKGVKDAFITAYYNGERIAINEALELLNAKGTSILEPKEGSKAAGEVVQNTNTQAVNLSENKNIPVEVVVEKPVRYYQIVTKKTFDEFPVEVLNRYNGHGSFYFDEKDRKVKSVIVDDEESLPQIHYFKDDVEKITMLPSSINLEETMISFNFGGVRLPGDVTDWLLRVNHRKEYFQHEESLEVRIFGLEGESLEKFIAEASMFGIDVQLNKKEEK